MNFRLLVVTLLLLLVGLVSLLALQWRLQKKLGMEDSSPQEVTVPLGGRRVVGGARAGIEFESRRGDRAQLIMRCGEAERWLALDVGKLSDIVCGVRVQLTGFSSATGTLATSRVHLTVSWGSPDGEAEEPTT